MLRLVHHQIPAGLNLSISHDLGLLFCLLWQLAVTCFGLIKRMHACFFTVACVCVCCRAAAEPFCGEGSSASRQPWVQTAPDHYEALQSIKAAKSGSLTFQLAIHLFTSGFNCNLELLNSEMSTCQASTVFLPAIEF